MNNDTMTTKLEKTFPTLYKRTSKGETQEWDIRVERVLDGDDIDSALIVTSYGLQGGAKQIATVKVAEGKNLGKKNETKVIEQAVADAQSRWDKKVKRGQYGLTVRGSDTVISYSPMLAKVYEKEARKVNWDEPVYIQPKLDGHRALCRFMEDGTVQMISRRGDHIRTCGHIIGQLEKLAPYAAKGLRLDGELYVHGMPLSKIGSLVKKERPGTKQVSYVVYDALLDAPYKDRHKAILRTLMSQHGDCATEVEDGSVCLCPTRRVRSERAAQEWQAEFLADGYEGAIIRHGDEPYKYGKRSSSLLKMKTFVDDEFKIVGAREGKGKHEGMAIFTCVTDEGHEFDVTAPGTHEEKKAAWDNREDLIGKLLTVKYQNMTATDSPVPFLPVAKTVREDI